MILKICLFLTLCVAREALGASFSNVFVQTGPDSKPAEEYYGLPYGYEYGTPQIAEYKSPVSYEYPAGSTSYSYRTATSYAEPSVAAIAAKAPSANVVYPAYTASAAPLYAGRNDPGYEYAYVYLNPSTGRDLKQLNDAELFRGAYAFLQPEPLVQYLADNNQGFNAIFKNYLPVSGSKHTEKAHHEKNHHEAVHKHVAPCHEVKSEALTAPDHSHDVTVHHEGHDPAVHEAHSEEHEPKHASHEHPESHETEHEHHVEHHESHETESPHHDHSIIIKIQEGGHHDSGSAEHDHVVEITHEESEGNEEQTEEKKTSEEVEEAQPVSESHTHENIVEEHEQQPSQETTLTIVPEIPVVGNNVYISYNDFIKCIQAALARGSTHPYYAPVPKPVSPLTYLIYNKPC